MDFAITYTPEQEAFRKDVRDWLQDNANYPIDELGPVPPETDHYSPEMKKWGLDFARKLGAIRWRRAIH